MVPGAVTWLCCAAGGRLLLHVPLGAESGGTLRKRERKEGKPAMVAPGTLVSGTVTSVHATHATVQLENGASFSALHLCSAQFPTGALMGTLCNMRNVTFASSRGMCL